MNQPIEAKQYPLLALRDVVVYPHMVIPLFVGRDKSIRALEEAMEDDKQIVLVAQINASDDDPAPNDLYQVGTVATILQLLKLPDGTVKVLVEGAYRAFTKSVSLNHTFSGTLTQTWNNDKSQKTRETISKDFRPLVGVSLTFTNGMSANAQYTTSEKLTKQLSYGQGKTKQPSSSLTISASYSKSGGFKLPFFGGKRLENNIDFTLSFTSSVNSSSLSKGTLDIFEETAKTENWSLQPKITYTFTKTVRGSIYFELGERKDMRLGSTKITAFGVNANISLAGG